MAAPHQSRPRGPLGLGFRLIGIALMQTLVVFLGHPTCALSVGRTSLLASVGTGSLLADRIAWCSSAICARSWAASSPRPSASC